MPLFRLGLFTLVFLFALPLQARAGRQNELPHGNQLQCDACHTQPNRGITDFGFDSFAATNDQGKIVWSELAAIDSDRDGYPNGLELGDPDGTWQQGDGRPAGDYWNPGDIDDNPCGNNVLEEVEDCDGGVDNTVTCESLGLGIGSVRCSTLCKFETSFCVVCGDGRINPNLEECEGDDFEGETCQSLGFQNGNLSCNAECKIDDSNCSGVPDTCADGQIQTGEDCDGSQLGGKTCALLGFDGGTLSCSSACKHDTSQCFGSSPEPDMGTSADGGTSQNDAGSQTIPSNEIVGEGACSTTNSKAPFLFSVLMLAFFFVPRKRKCFKG